MHTELNKLITARLPLALPPHAENPALYTLGIETFSSIYIAFESALQEIINKTLDSDLSIDVSLDAHARHKLAVRTCLATLVPPGLFRTKAIRQDLAFLNKHRIKLSRECAPLSGLKADIQSLAQETPHALVAYTWVMFMAIFSGGRWIRQQLRNAGPEFWGHDDVSKTLDGILPSPTIVAADCGFTLFDFDGELDGEDIRADFKTRLGNVEALLTEKERAEVVSAAQRLFMGLIAVVHDLDEQAALAGISVPATTNDKSVSGGFHDDDHDDHHRPVDMRKAFYGLGFAISAYVLLWFFGML